MARPRPAAVTTLGVLNIVLGSLGLLFGCCGGTGMAFMFNLSSSSSGSRGIQTVSPYQDMWDFMQRELPVYGAVTWASLVVSILMSAVLLAAGIGLLNRQGWARITCIVFGVFNILLVLADIVFRLAFVLPALDRWRIDFHRRYPWIINDAHSSFVFGHVVTVICAAIWLIYAIVLLVVASLPHVGAACSPRPFADDDDEDDDRDFKRRPRRHRDD
jgi:hypothetical protein